MTDDLSALEVDLAMLKMHADLHQNQGATAWARDIYTVIDNIKAHLDRDRKMKAELAKILRESIYENVTVHDTNGYGLEDSMWEVIKKLEAAESAPKEEREP